MQENFSVEQTVLRAMNKYKDNPPSIRVINQHASPSANAFQFSHINPTEVMRQIDFFDATISNSGCIPTRTLKAMKEMVCPYPTDCINSKMTAILPVR